MLLSRLVTHTWLPSGEVMIRTGLHPAVTVDTTAEDGAVSARARSITLIVPSDGSAALLRIRLVAYSQRWSGEMAIPMGCSPRGIFPTTSDGPKPSISALSRLNTTRAALFSRVTNANLSSGESATSTAPSPNWLVSVPTTAASPASALATSMTIAPLFAATSRYLPLWVSCSLPVEPGAGSTWVRVGPARSHR